MSSLPSCHECGFPVPPHADRCPHCARPSLFPNVRAAEALAERTALELRYDETVQRSATATRPVLQAFEEAVTQSSHAVLTRPATEVLRLASGESELYATFYSLVDAGVRTPSGDWDRLRAAVDERLFNYYKEHIRFAALSLDGRGLDHYGECHVQLKDEMIAHRATVFEENSVVFMVRRRVGLTEALPEGYRATWPERGRLAIAKLASRLGPQTGPDDFAGVLVRNGTKPEEDDFIEVHIYGSISIHGVSAVRLRGGRVAGVRLKALRKKLEQYGIPLKDD